MTATPSMQALPAQAIPWTVFDFASRHMQRPDGSDIFQRRQRWANATPHIRWMAASMLEALTWLQRTTGAGT
jgi:hypothetical protein